MLQELSLETGLRLLENHVLRYSSTRHYSNSDTRSRLQSYFLVVIERRVQSSLSGLSNICGSASRWLKNIKSGLELTGLLCM